MVQPTSNPYTFKYIQTGISGKGITTVYLPTIPDSFPIGNNFKRTPLPKDWDRWRKEEEEGLAVNPNFIHPKIDSFVAQEWDKRLNGYWFLNNGEPTYITGKHYFYLNYWMQDNVYRNFRDTDKEIFYYIDYAFEDTKCFGIIWNSIRRAGKSSILGLLAYEDVSRTKNFNVGIQAQDDSGAKRFFQTNVRYGHNKMADFFKPVYDYGVKTLLSFYQPDIRGKEAKNINYHNIEQLESKITYEVGDEYAYDGQKLHRYICEEPGKPMQYNLAERHDVIKPTLKEGHRIIGKACYATTVEDTDNTGKVYERLFRDSDTDLRNNNGETISGLYPVFLPAYFAFMFDNDSDPEGFGLPLAQEAKEILLNTRKGLEHDSAKLSREIRKYPFTLAECFYTDASQCIFNTTILERRRSELLESNRFTVRMDLVWNGAADKKKVIAMPNKNGRFYFSALPDNIGIKSNNVTYKGENVYQPNNTEIVIGIDPIEYGKTITGGSKPAMVALRKYDEAIDGELNEEALKLRALGQHDYKTNKLICCYNYRPEDPTEFYEDAMKLMFYLGCQAHIENNKQGLITHLRNNGYKRFMIKKYNPEGNLGNADQYGTPSTSGLIGNYTSKLQHYVLFFGHTIPFIQIIDELLKFNPNKTTDYDLVVGFGFSLLGAETQITRVEVKELDLKDYFASLNRVVRGKSVPIY
jgi:hypothetical protein